MSDDVAVAAGVDDASADQQELTVLHGLGIDFDDQVRRVIYLFQLAYPNRGWTIKEFSKEGYVNYEAVSIAGEQPSFDELQIVLKEQIVTMQADLAANDAMTAREQTLQSKVPVQQQIIEIMRAGVSGDWSKVQEFLTVYDGP